MQKGQDGSKVLLEEVEEGLPYFGGEDGRVQGEHVVLLHHGILGRDGSVGMFPVTLPLGVIPFTAVVVIVGAAVGAAVGVVGPLIVDTGRCCDIPFDAGR